MRPATIADISALHHLIRATEIADGLEVATALDEVADHFSDPEIDTSRDLVVLEGSSSGGSGVALIGWGLSVHHPSGTRLERSLLQGGIHPDHRRQGLGRQIVSWSLERAAQQLGTTSQHLPAHAMLHVYDHQVETLALAARFDLLPVRFGDELLRTLEDVPAQTPIDGVSIRSWESTDSEGTRLVSNAAFADHWGSTSRSAESWAAVLGRSGVRLDLSFVAVDDQTGEIVGYSLNDHFPQDFELTQRSEGWIGSLGTLRSHRKRGIASALIIASLHRFREAGLDHAMLGVDTENPSGAYHLYEGLGFQPVRRSVTLRKTIREGEHADQTAV